MLKALHGGFHWALHIGGDVLEHSLPLFQLRHNRNGLLLWLLPSILKMGKEVCEWTKCVSKDKNWIPHRDTFSKEIIIAPRLVPAVTIREHPAGEIILLHNLKVFIFCWKTRIQRLDTLFKFLIHVPEFQTGRLRYACWHPGLSIQTLPHTHNPLLLASECWLWVWCHNCIPKFPSSSSNLERTGLWAMLSSFKQPFRHLPHNKFKMWIYKSMSFSNSSLRARRILCTQEIPSKLLFYTQYRWSQRPFEVTDVWSRQWTSRLPGLKSTPHCFSY